MELIFRICLFIAGIINFLPSFIAFLPSKIAQSYGIELPDQNFELLLRHRGILFGIVGGIMLYSVFTKKYYDLATLIGLISMVSFLILFCLSKGEINKELTLVMKVDAAAILILVVGFMLLKTSNSIGNLERRGNRKGND